MPYYFINFRSHAVGGWVDTNADPKIQYAPPATSDGFNTPVASRSKFLAELAGRDVLVATHGFNVDFVAGVAALTNWADLLRLPPPSCVLGVLWPGDSAFIPAIDYPLEPRVADETGKRLGPFLDDVLSQAASVSFVSHSLGARVVLQTISHMARRPRRVTLMAGAIDDTCLKGEFQDAAAKIGEISVLASKRDEVLNLAFPLGNLIGGVLDQGHPWWHTALGRDGPAKPVPDAFQPPFQIPSNWAYGHHHYLQMKPGYDGVNFEGGIVPPEGSAFPIPDPTAPDDPEKSAPGWQEAWSSAFVRRRFT